MIRFFIISIINFLFIELINFILHLLIQVANQMTD